MSALQALVAHNKRVAALRVEEYVIRDKIDFAKQVITEVGAAEQPLAEIKAKRRNLLAQIFLGADDKSDPNALDAELKAAEKKLDATRPKKEAAEAALEILNAKLSGVYSRINEELKNADRFHYEALLEHARKTVPRFINAVENLYDSYAEVLGTHHAADAFADLAGGRPPQTSLPLQTRVSLPWLPGVDETVRSRNVATQVSAHGDAARKMINEIVRAAQGEFHGPA